MAVIIAGWLLLAVNGKLFKDGGSFGLESIGGKLTNLWDTIQQDILKIKEKTSVPSGTTTLTPEQQRIKNLEDAIFPQFSNTNSKNTNSVNTNSANTNSVNSNTAPVSNTNQQ